MRKIFLLIVAMVAMAVANAHENVQSVGAMSKKMHNHEVSNMRLVGKSGTNYTGVTYRHITFSKVVAKKKLKETFSDENIKGADEYFMQSEHTGWPSIYALDKRLKTFNIKSDSNITGTYHIDGSGGITKHRETTNREGILNDDVKKRGDEYIDFVTLVKEVSMAKQRF